ncbi:hypothetical protein BpHYR1_021651 [Brachionus plicatilis]|uniref:Uncharacterized protein n=1 Tax=Brachionus plicatilis TaxID=10195 RepID=A0A3M7RUG7_BRAPC|nr:hypothetical protein BpHYR1_021651 [Brachionus plicatilis]
MLCLHSSILTGRRRALILVIKTWTIDVGMSLIRHMIILTIRSRKGFSSHTLQMSLLRHWPDAPVVLVLGILGIPTGIEGHYGLGRRRRSHVNAGNGVDILGRGRRYGGGVWRARVHRIVVVEPIGVVGLGLRLGSLVIWMGRNAEYFGGGGRHRHVRRGDFDHGRLVMVAICRTRRGRTRQRRHRRICGPPVRFQKVGQVIARVLQSVLVQDHIEVVGIGLGQFFGV